jgi:hypothetical protein
VDNPAAVDGRAGRCQWEVLRRYALAAALLEEPDPFDAALDDDESDDDELDPDELDDDDSDDDDSDDEDLDELAAGSFEPLLPEVDSPDDDPFELPEDSALPDRLSVR